MKPLVDLYFAQGRNDSVWQAIVQLGFFALQMIVYSLPFKGGCFLYSKFIFWRF